MCVHAQLRHHSCYKSHIDIHLSKEVRTECQHIELAIGNRVELEHRCRRDKELVSLKGVTNQCRARYKVSFGANIGLPADGTAGPISLAIAIDGEPVRATTMTVTPAAVEEFFNVFSAIYIDVPRGCCVTVSVQNVSEVDVDVVNANLIVDRTA